jgi:hypothetical protein
MFRIISYKLSKFLQRSIMSKMTSFYLSLFQRSLMSRMTLY